METNRTNNNSPRNVFDQLFDSEEAANLKIRAKLIDRLIDHIEEHGLTQKEAAEEFGVDQPRISYLVNGKISKFTIDYLINMCNRAGISVDVHFDGAYAGRQVD